jgi:hypothetical protein
MRVILCVLAVLLVGCVKHPTDAQLQATLQKNYGAFSNLVGELKAASVERVEWNGSQIVVDSTQTNPPALTSKLSPHFKAIGQPLTVVNAGKGSQVWFYISTRGLSVSGSAKGLLYDETTETTPTRIVPDTDASSRTNSPFTVLRPLLQTNWFAFYSR